MKDLTLQDEIKIVARDLWYPGMDLDRMAAQIETDINHAIAVGNSQIFLGSYYIPDNFGGCTEVSIWWKKERGIIYL